LISIFGEVDRGLSLLFNSKDTENEMRAIPEITVETASLGGRPVSIAHTSQIKSVGKRMNDDVVSVRADNDRLSVLLADGATGVGLGWMASGVLRDRFAGEYPDFSPQPLVRFLFGVDHAIHSVCRGDADTTGIVMLIEDDMLHGASAGDSEAWLFSFGGCQALTARQHRKPRLGNGGHPVPFSQTVKPGDVLVVASDGLWNAVSPGDTAIAGIERDEADTIVARLLSMARSSVDGQFHDDISIVCIRF
jgi:serine/threonine protein phosphatase PrpC